MKTLFAGALIFLAFSLGERAFAKCDGIEEDLEGISCSTRSSKNSCESIKGCHWTPDPAFIRICNKTDKKISIATQMVRPNYNRIAEAGWRNLEVGGCGDFEAPNATSFSYFAKSYHGHFYWYGNGQPMCYDASGKAFDTWRTISQNSCGALTEIQAFQTIPVKEDDFIQLKIEGPGVDLSPAPETGGGPVQAGLTARALAICKATGEYSVRKGNSLEEAKSMALDACQSSGNQCELVLWLGQDRPACMAIVSGAGPFRAWAWSYDGKEAAVNVAIKNCQDNGQNCNVDFIICNND